MKAFTLIEMLVVMLLSSIVVGLTYLYFTQFQNHINQINKTDDVYQIYSQFTMVFKKDLDEAEYIYYPRLYELELKTGNDKKIEYWFDDNRVIRNNMDILDTFNILTTDIQVAELTDHKGLVNNIKFDTEISKNKFVTFCFLKNYTAKSLFRNYKQDEE